MGREFAIVYGANPHCMGIFHAHFPIVWRYQKAFLMFHGQTFHVAPWGNPRIATESISEFAQVLKDNGLVTDRLFSRDEIAEIRRRQGQMYREHPVERDFGKSIGQVDMSNAEQMYAQSLNNGKSIPSVMFELTYNCSEKCIHCYNSGASRNECEVSLRNREEMTLEDYRKAIDEYLRDRG